MSYILVCDLCGTPTKDTVTRNIVEVPLTCAHLIMDYRVNADDGHMCKACWTILFGSIQIGLDRIEKRKKQHAAETD